MRKRVVLAGFFHETNTFLRDRTTLEEFAARRGEQVFGAEGDASPLAGVLEAARERNWDLIPVVDLRAMPSATVADEVVELFWRTMQATVENEAPWGIDGVYLVLHGAMVSESVDDVEGELLHRLRKLDAMRDVPICGVLDLHANFTAAMAEYADGFIAYRENPHIDAKAAAMDAAGLLDRLMTTGERPATVWEHPPLLWPPTGTATAASPMRPLEERARAIEEDPEILAVNIFAGFSFADIQEAGVSFAAVTVGDPARVAALLQELSELAWSLREVGNKTGMPLDEAMRRLEERDHGPVLLVEPADNIGAGAPGENTSILRALVERGVQDAGVILNDPEIVRSLEGKSPGERVRVVLGGKSGEVGAEPLSLEVQLLSISDGCFTLEDPQSHLASLSGTHIDMGPCAVVRSGGVRVLVTSRKTPPFDLGQWRSQGIHPEELFAIGVKAAAGHRRAYDPISVGSYVVDLPGPCAENLARLKFEHIRRPVYPLDEDFVPGGVSSEYR